jgi:hypothetical protein
MSQKFVFAIRILLSVDAKNNNSMTCRKNRQIIDLVLYTVADGMSLKMFTHNVHYMRMHRYMCIHGCGFLTDLYTGQGLVMHDMHLLAVDIRNVLPPRLKIWKHGMSQNTIFTDILSSSKIPISFY